MDLDIVIVPSSCSFSFLLWCMLLCFSCCGRPFSCLLLSDGLTMDDHTDFKNNGGRKPFCVFLPTAGGVAVGSSFAKGLLCDEDAVESSWVSTNLLLLGPLSLITTTKDGSKGDICLMVFNLWKKKGEKRCSMLQNHSTYLKGQ